MANVHKEVAEKIKDGSYYSDAREWYARKYLYPMTERAFLFFIAAVIGTIFIISIQNIQFLLRDDDPTPIIIKADNSTDYFSVIKPLANEHGTTQGAVAKYLLKDYIQTRENYSYNENTVKNLRHNLKKIKGSSSKTVLNEYKNYMDETNPYSPIVRYKNHTSRSVEIKSLSFADGQASSGKAKIVFEATTTNKKTKEQDKSLWETTIHFRLPDIETLARTGAPLRFLVKYYKAKPIK